MESVSVIKISERSLLTNRQLRARASKLVHLAMEIFLRAGIFGLVYALLSQQVNVTPAMSAKKISSNKNYVTVEYSKKLSGPSTQVDLTNEIYESDGQQKKYIWDHQFYQHTDPTWLTANTRQGIYFFEFALMSIELVFSPLTNRGPPHLSVQYLLPPPEPIEIIIQKTLPFKKSILFNFQYLHSKLFSTGLIFSQRGSYVIS